MSEEATRTGGQVDWDRIVKEHTVVLPQHFLHHSKQPTLVEAVRDLIENYRYDDRDYPGTLDDGRSVLHERHYSRTDRPVPVFDIEKVNGVNSQRPSPPPVPGIGIFPIYPAREFAQVTTTTMSPSAAEAFVELLRNFPDHPFVQPRLAPGISLNGSDSYFAVNGPALAIPTFTPSPDKKPKTVQLPVHVCNPHGIDEHDFVRAAIHHPDLTARNLLLADMNIADITILEAHARLRRSPFTGSPDVSTLKTAFHAEVNGSSVGIFDTYPEAHTAVMNALGADFTPTHLMHGSHYRNPYSRDYEISACLTDGETATPPVRGDMYVTEATATVEAPIETVPYRSSKQPQGWLLAWQTYDWHRHPLTRTYYLDAEDRVVYYR